MSKALTSLSAIANRTSSSSKDSHSQFTDKMAIINDAVTEFSKQRSERNNNLIFSGSVQPDNEPGQLREIVTKLVDASKPFQTNNYFLSLQKWKGFVTKLNEQTFEVRLEDSTSQGTYEIAEFENREVSPGDRELLQIGAAFYWSIGYSYNGNQIEKKSVIRFQRLNNWSEEEYDEAIDRGVQLYNFFQDKNGNL